MRIGRESAYAIAGLLVLAGKPMGTVMLLRDIARARDVPRHFLAKIFQKLARSNIVVSSRGAIRGYALARRAKQIKVKEILLATEGPDLFEISLRRRREQKEKREGRKDGQRSQEPPRKTAGFGIDHVV